MKLIISESKRKTAKTFTDWIIALINASDVAHIALSGGSTPKIVFDALAARRLPEAMWSKVHLYWGDERCVPPDDADSNFKMTVDHLLSKVSIPDKNIHRIKGENEPKEEARRYAQALEDAVPPEGGLPCFDLDILGMGDDGHTASIFPHEIELWGSERICEVAEHPESGQKRITITGQVINNAKKVAFLVTGDSKAEKVGEIIDERGEVENYPASLVHPKSEALYWFLDEAAAAQITAPST